MSREEFDDFRRLSENASIEGIAVEFMSDDAEFLKGIFPESGNVGLRIMESDPQLGSDIESDGLNRSGRQSPTT